MSVNTLNREYYMEVPTYNFNTDIEKCFSDPTFRFSESLGFSLEEYLEAYCIQRGLKINYYPDELRNTLLSNLVTGFDFCKKRPTEKYPENRELLPILDVLIQLYKGKEERNPELRSEILFQELEELFRQYKDFLVAGMPQLLIRKSQDRIMALLDEFTTDWEGEADADPSCGLVFALTDVQIRARGDDKVRLLLLLEERCESLNLLRKTTNNCTLPKGLYGVMKRNIWNTAIFLFKRKETL